MEEFGKRYYLNFAQLRKDLKEIGRLRKLAKTNEDKDKINNDFKERLMLTVTGVNDCRYCSYAHSKAALKSGIKEEEVCMLLQGEYDNCPEEEIPAIFYAQHWADNNGNADQESWQKLVEIYGEKKANSIEMYLRMIRLGNLSGNTFDYFGYKLTRGKFGLKK